jgi:hypothetical protein
MKAHQRYSMLLSLQRKQVYSISILHPAKFAVKLNLSDLFIGEESLNRVKVRTT